MKSLKRTFITLLLAVMTFGVSNAEFRFGLKAGVNMNNLSSNYKEIKDNATGFTGGIMTEFQVPLIGLCFDLSLMYTRMNATADVVVSENGGNVQTIDIDQNKNFLELPLNIKYKIGLPIVGKIISPYIFTGPSFAFKLGKQMIDDFKSKTCQVAWNVGLGLELVRHLQIGASYGFGINNIAGTLTSLNATDIKVKNNYWTITAAYLF